MEKKINQKVLRFVELSVKFSKGEYDVIPSKEQNTVGMPINYSVSFAFNTGLGCSHSIDGRELYIDKDGVVKAKDNKPITRADQIRTEAEVKAKLLEEYFEYSKLQVELLEYFKALNKITE